MAGRQELRTLKPGEKLAAKPGQHVEVLGANLPSRFEAKGKDVSFVTASGERFTIEGVAPTPSKRPWRARR